MAAARIASGSTPGSSSISVRSIPGRRIRAPGTSRDPGEAVVALDRETDEAPAGRHAGCRGPGRRRRPARGRRSRSTRRAPRPSPSDGSRRSASGPGRASSRNASRSSATLTGSRPVNGSSISRTGGSWRIAAMSWIFCWLPLDSSSARRSAELGDPEAGQPVERLATGAIRRDAVERCEIGELVDDDHPRVEAALLGQVAPRPRGRTRLSVPFQVTVSAIGLEDAEDDPHRRRLARAVRAEEAEHLAARDLEREAVERDGRAEALVRWSMTRLTRRRIARSEQARMARSSGPALIGRCAASPCDDPRVTSPANSPSPTVASRIHADRAARTLEIDWQDGHGPSTTSWPCAGSARAPIVAARRGCRAGSTPRRP